MVQPMTMYIIRTVLNTVRALVQAGIQFDMQVYTNRNHGIFGGKTREHLMNRVANFFIQNL